MTPVALAGFVLLASVVPAAPLTYMAEEVHGRVYRSPAGNAASEKRFEASEKADAGDLVRTNWLGRVTLAVPERSTRFEILSSTTVKLAGGEPGVLLVLERGRLKAIFDALLGNEAPERRVATPGALLAVRGTRYGVEVDAKGQTGLAVFEGTVEVIPTDQSPPFRVTKDQFCRFGPGAAPRIVPMGSMGMSEGSWPSGGHSGMMQPGKDGSEMMPGSGSQQGGSMHGASSMGPKR